MSTFQLLSHYQPFTLYLTSAHANAPASSSPYSAFATCISLSVFLLSLKRLFLSSLCSLETRTIIAHNIQSNSFCPTPLPPSILRGLREKALHTGEAKRTPTSSYHYLSGSAAVLCRLIKEFSVKACKECCFSHGGHCFAVVNGNTISIYNTYTFDNIGNLRLALSHHMP